MPLFNVVAPCVVDGLHYIHPTTQPIEVDAEAAAELVAAGALEPYPPVSPDTVSAETEQGGYVPPAELAARKPETDANKPQLVVWLLNNGSELSGPELDRLTKAELWERIDAHGEAD